MRTIAVILSTLVVLGILGVIFIFTGWYNVSAMNPEPAFTKWILSTTSDNSVEYRAGDISSVPDLNDSAKIFEGLEHYKEMCEGCHRGPGMEESELAKGLNPPPPNLVKHGPNMDPKEIFWVTKHGIKMTGMPAWGKTHSDDKIWAITAAVKHLNQVSPEQYNSIPKNMEEDEHGTTEENENK